MTEKYKKIDLSNIDRKKIRQSHGIETNEKIKIYNERKHAKELWTFPKARRQPSSSCADAL